MIERAIDFETANERRDSACAVGLADVFQPDTPIFRRLIRPEPARFSPFCVAVHGIRPYDVADEPVFAGIWPDLAPLLEGATILAHNASFDAGVLNACLLAAGLSVPPLRFICTVDLARAAFPQLRSHKLNIVAHHLGIELNHHEAGSDASACAAIGRHVADMLGVATVAEAADRLGVGARRPGRPPVTVQTSVALPSPTRRVDGQNFAVTGTLVACSRPDAARAIARAGGTFQAYIRQDTDWLVVGLSPGRTKLTAAQARQRRYGRLRMLDEAEFMEMLGLDGKGVTP
ncbi:exonuclease domain-containing protein [Niveispirillum sp. KHB5.9]|uniref:exonuclease domain-containing protein n=1 Tax=Niveispirillum sp. KHB5.9 TaxID=3400269 RepID=UPI003A8805EF